MTEHERHVRWLKTITADESIVWAAIAELDKIWHASVTSVQYLPRGAGDWAPFREAAMTGAILTMPRIEFLRVKPAVVSFVSGRHRFAFCRDHGGEGLPIAVSREDTEIAMKLFNYEGPRFTRIKL